MYSFSFLFFWCSERGFDLFSHFFLFSFVSLVPLMRFKIEEKQWFKYDWHHSYPAVRSWLSEDIDRLLCWPLWPLWPLLRLAALWPCTHVDFFGGWIWMLKIMLVQTNYLTIAKWCLALPAQLNSGGIIGHTTKWQREVVNRVKLCTISQFQLTFSRGRIPISLSIASSSRWR